MDPNLASDILTGDSDEIEDLKANLPIIEGFIDLAQELDALPEISKRFYEESRSLYQATCNNRSTTYLEKILTKFFGPPAKPAGKPLPRKLRKNSAVKYLGGVEKDQSLFLLKLKTGEFYGALWPWRRNKTKIEIHMGYCSDWMVDEHYQQLENLVKRSLSRNAFAQMDTGTGGQVHGIGLSSFLQMAEMEQSTFSLNVICDDRSGKLHVHEGQLIAAETEEYTGRDAAYRIIAWEGVNITIDAADLSKTDEIQQPLMHVLMESLKIKDEITSTFEHAPMPPPPKPRPKAEHGKKIVKLERAPRPKAPKKVTKLAPVLAAVLCVLILLACIGTVAMYISNARKETEAFKAFMMQVDRTDNFEKKISMLEDYASVHPDSKQISEIKKKMESLNENLQDRAFESTVLEVSSLPVDETYEKKAIALYGDFLEKYPSPANQQRVNSAIADIKKLLDQYYYEELKRAARLDLSERLKVYRDYIERFPQGRYQKDVDTLINEMGRQYLEYLKSEDEKCAETKRWGTCMQRYEKFIADFEGTALAKDAQATISALQDRRDLMNLRKIREEAGINYKKAHDAYRDYLKEHPNSSQKETISKEYTELKSHLAKQNEWQAIRSFATNSRYGLFERIQRLDNYIQSNPHSPYLAKAQDVMGQLEADRQIALRRNKIETQKQEQLARLKMEKERQEQLKLKIEQMRKDLVFQLNYSNRFQTNGNDTFMDQSTGTTWTLLDSHQELGGCIDYDAAKTYIQNLRAGGYRDWRLPSAGELAPLYKKAPFFPASGAAWYWTNEAAYKGFHTVVTTVTTKPETQFVREYHNTTECGSARAIRP